MSEPLKPMGAGMRLAPELMLRQVILEGLVQLAGDQVRMDEIFGRVDDLRQGTANQWLIDMRNAVSRMVPGQSQHGVTVRVGYPAQEARFPFVSVVPESGAENGNGAVIGDILSREYKLIGTFDATAPESFRVERQTTIGIDEDVIVQVGSWTRIPEESAALNAVVHNILFRDKGRLMSAGVREISFSTGGFQPDPDFYASVGYVPVIRCSLTWTRRQTRRTSPVPVYYTMNAPTFTNDDL